MDRRAENFADKFRDKSLPELEAMVDQWIPGSHQRQGIAIAINRIKKKQGRDALGREESARKEGYEQAERHHADRQRGVKIAMAIALLSAVAGWASFLAARFFPPPPTDAIESRFDLVEQRLSALEGDHAPDQQSSQPTPKPIEPSKQLSPSTSPPPNPTSDANDND